MEFKKVGNRTWSINGRQTSCRSTVKAQVMQDYFRRNRIKPGSFTSLPLPEFKKHHLAIKALWDDLGL